MNYMFKIIKLKYVNCHGITSSLISVGYAAITTREKVNGRVKTTEILKR